MSSESHYFRKMARGGVMALAGKVLTYPLGLLLAIVLTRVLSPEELGGYFLAMSLILIAAALVQFGAGPVMVKFVASALAVNDDGRARRALVLAARWVAASSLVAIVALQIGLGSWLLDSLEDGDVLRGSLTWIALLVAAYAVISFSCEVLRSFSDLGSASLFAEQLLQRLLLLLVLVVAWSFDLHLDLQSVFVLMAVSSISTMLLGLAFIWLKFRRLGVTVISPIGAKELMRHAPPFFFMRLNFWLMDTAPVWILGMFQPPEIVALYGVGNMLALIVLAPWTVINTSLGPAVVKLHTENRARMLQTLLGTVGGIASLGAACVALILIVFGKDILAVVFTEAMAPAYMTTVFLAVGRGISVFFGAPALLLSMTRHHMTVFRVLLCSGILGLVGYIAAARFGGIEWVALVGAILAIMQAVVLTYFASRYLQLSTFSTFRLREWGAMAQQILPRS